MKPRTQVVIASLAGTLCLYCAPQAVDSVVERTPIAEAMAEDEEARCCRPPSDRFTKLGEWTLPADSGNEWVWTPPLNVAAYRELVVYVSQGEADLDCGGRYEVKFRPDESTPFGDVPGLGAYGSAGRLRIGGPWARLRLTYNLTNCPHEVTFVLAGVTP
jgi:hypothetical protein